MESEDVDPRDASSSKVLEYYTKYSLNKKLATYFCGDVTINKIGAEKSVCSPVENLPGVIVTDIIDCEVERAIVEEHTIKSRPPLIGEDKYDNVGLDDSENEIVRSFSSSSVASNRKLEWDSGADIGYENCHKLKFLHKSLSLPTLRSSDKIDFNKTLLRLSPEGKVTESSTQTQQKESSSESSDTQIKPSEVPLTSSSSDNDKNPGQVIQNSSTSSYISKSQDSSTESKCDSEVKNNVLDFLHKKVGLPVASSTPVYKLKQLNLTILPSVPVSQKLKSESDLGCFGNTAINSNLIHSSGKTFTSVISMVDNLKPINDDFDISFHIPSGVKKVNHSDLLNLTETNGLINRNKTLKQLCIIKPLVVECLESLKVLDKVVQTTPLSFISIGIQTEEENHITPDYNFMKNEANRQSIIYFYHSDSDREPSFRTLGTNTVSNATDQDISNCDSFEYVFGNQCDVSSKQNASKLDMNQISPHVDAPGDFVRVITGANNLRQSRGTSDLTFASSDSVNRVSPKSQINPLGDLIAHEQTKNSEDISKNIDLIKKLIKSKKYDKITKQYYIKKLVHTIVNSNENSDISVKSDVRSDIGISKQTASNKPQEFMESVPCRSEQRRNLQEYLPWLPAPLPSKDLEIKTFSTEILPETALDINDDINASNINSKSFQVKKNSVFTLPSDSKYYNTQSGSDRSSTNEVNPNFQQSEPAQFSTDTSVQDSDYVNKNSFQNWKEAKTLSEQKFELQQAIENSKKNCGDVESTSPSESDTLLNFAKKERENQINWINNEIVHLNKLKHLLQKKDCKVNVDILTKPEISNMHNIKKSTSVYMITTEKPGSPKNRRTFSERPISSNESTSSRKETINVKVASHKHAIWYKNGERFGRSLTHSNTYPPVQCKCAKSNANNQICTDETCAYSTTSQLRKHLPHRTNESSHKEVRPSRLCKCAESKIGNQVCSDEKCVHLTKQKSHQRTKEISRKEILPSTICRCSESNTKDPICCDDTCPHFLTSSWMRKTSPPRRTSGDLQKELRKKPEKLNANAGITHMTLNSGPKQAKLISSEVYSSELHPYTCIRRYVFEIPLPPSVLDKNTYKGELKKVKNKLPDEYAAQHVMIEEKMSFPDKRSDTGNTVMDEFTHQGEHYRIVDIDDEKTQRRPYYVDSYALTEIQGDQSKKFTEKDCVDRKLENIPESTDSYALIEICKDNGKRDLDKQGTQRSNVTLQTSILDIHRSDSENLRERRTKPSSVNYESSTEISVNEFPIIGASHKHTQKDDMKNVNLQKTNASDKHTETDKVKIIGNTTTKDNDNRVKYSTGKSTPHDEEYKVSDLKDQKTTGSECSGSISEDQKRRAVLEERDSEWENKDDNGNSEDHKRGMSRTLNEDNKWEDQKRRTGSEYKYTRSEDQKSKTGAGHVDSKSVNTERIGLEYEHRKYDDYKRRRSENEDCKWKDPNRGMGSKYSKAVAYKGRIESEDEEDKWEDEKRRLENEDSKWKDRKRGMESEYSTSVDYKGRIESGDEDNKWEDQKRRLRSEYSKSNDHKRRIEPEHEDSKWEDQERRIGPQYIRSDDHKRTELKNKGSKWKDQKRRLSSNYKDSKSEDQKTKAQPKHYKDSKLENQERIRRRTRKASSKKDETEESLRFVRDEKYVNTEESRKGKTTKNLNDETDDVHVKEENILHGERQSVNKLTQTSLTRVDKKRDYASSSTSSSSQTESSSSGGSQTCICPCCRKNKSRASALVSNLQRDIQPLLCQPCHTQNQQNNWSNSYRYPGHVCNCYTILKRETVQQIKKTVDELGDLEQEQYCSCTFAGKNKNLKYCSYCDCKKKSGRKKAVAYMLTFEQGSNESDEEIRRRRSLEEVKVKIPHTHKKKNKDNENKKRKAKKNDSSYRRYRHQNHKKHKHPKIVTLQEYLNLNRPNFIENAEQRRKCLIDLAYMREQRCEKYKQLLALSNGLPPPKNDADSKSKRVFSSKKMKEITAQHYKKLPEVQQKLKDNKDKQIKTANRLLADIFNKKLRENVLKGRHTLSTSTSVINLI